MSRSMKANPLVLPAMAKYGAHGAVLDACRHRYNDAQSAATAVQEVDFHITPNCGSACEYCYVDPHGESKKRTIFGYCQSTGYEDGRSIIEAIRYVAGAKDLVFVGGDPCLNQHLPGFLVLADRIGLNACVLSNTHRYFLEGEEVPIEAVAPYICELDFTLHGLAPEHDKFNHTPGSHDRAYAQLRKFMAVRDEDQSVGIVLNMVPGTIGTPERLKAIMLDAINGLNMVPGQDFFTIQRIAPSGKALTEWEKWKISPPMLTAAFDVFDQVKAEYGLETKVCIDAFPWCALPKKHWHYLEPLEGGCNWGKPGGVLSVMPNGMLQRCALCAENLGVNIVSLKDSSAFADFIEGHPTLIAVNEHRHLNGICLECELLPKCGGGCVIANETSGWRGNPKKIGDPYHPCTCFPRRGIDYLAFPPERPR